MRSSAWRTVMTPPWRSTSDQRSARASPIRRPVPSRKANRYSWRWPRAAASKALAWSGVRGCNLGAAAAGRVCQRSDIARDQFPAERLVQRTTQDGAHVLDRPWRQAVSISGIEKMLNLLRGQFRELVLAE